MKIALYKNNGGGESVLRFDEIWARDLHYVQVSEALDIEFPRLPPEVTVPAELAVIDAAEAELRNKFNEKLAEINTRRANLLALTQQVPA